MTTRLSLPTIFALMVTLGLFYLMQSLIAGGKSAITEDTIGEIVEFVRIKEEPEVQTTDREPDKPQPPDEPPPEVQPNPFKQNVAESIYRTSGIDGPDGPDIKRDGIGISDGEYLPVVKVQPNYPRRALSRGMSGWVIVEFTVTKHGTVRDVHVLQHCAWIKSPQAEGECHDSPNSIFDRAALRAAEKFKYKPRIIDGEPTATAGVRNKITFELANG